ncbi:MAG: hypothetical protein HQM12_04745 [SAR324 cluster bacterium]|nr:hypothetical protein [SAR324 cluster bacterium]MBF0350607.1 hypothetical protein [SAR324 cluster bacterium]
MKKIFDCVEMKREGAKKILEQLQGITIEQQLDYWKLIEKKIKEKANPQYSIN